MRQVFAIALLCAVAAPTLSMAADVAVRPRVVAAASAPEGGCLRWIWQTYSWYNDCWWQQEPYVRSGTRMVRR